MCVAEIRCFYRSTLLWCSHTLPANQFRIKIGGAPEFEVRQLGFAILAQSRLSTLRSYGRRLSFLQCALPSPPLLTLGPLFSSFSGPLAYLPLLLTSLYFPTGGRKGLGNCPFLTGKWIIEYARVRIRRKPGNGVWSRSGSGTLSALFTSRICNIETLN